MAIKDLFGKELKVINIGLLSFKESLEDAGVKVIQVDWRPPAGGDEEVMEALKKLLGK
ncbi:MAG: fdrA domain protein [Caldiserica bacterium]|nr:fdrA domain protein [Caldisericia bacterium]RLD14073.1 MAG: fdrA domain protein [Caldisericota bacterium]RLD15299.1 MAG: fdrA domain protein [Caldisericota bacterium]RLD17078.1 MAG: fdrA domain protein [Caldisericota bacterium]HDH63209.1 fdrA domain protein [Bacillota bacterium]